MKLKHRQDFVLTKSRERPHLLSICLLLPHFLPTLAFVVSSLFVARGWEVSRLHLLVNLTPPTP